MFALVALVACGDPPDDQPIASGPSPAELNLPESERAYIWELEHAGNLLGAHGFAQVRDALREADRDALRTVLAETFEGTVYASPEVVERSSDVVRARRERGTGATAMLSADEFVDLLLEKRGRLATMEGAKLGLTRIGPVDRDRLDGDWEADGYIRIWGATAAGLLDVQFLVELTIRRPTRENLEAPRWLRGCAIRELEVSESLAPLFTDVTSDVGIDTSRLYDNWKQEFAHNFTGGVYACDFNRDGCVDLLITDADPAQNMFLAGGPEGRYENVTDAVGLAGLREVEPRGGHAVIADLDNDGWEDVLFPSGELWRNVAGIRFERIDDWSNFLSLTGDDALYQRKVSTITAADFDRDGLVDLYVLRKRQRPDSWLEQARPDDFRNQLLRNTGDWQFADVTTQTETRGEQRIAFTAVWFDANGDLWPDFYLPDEFGDGLLYVNQEGRRFEQRDVSTAAADFGTMGAATGDIDNDGRIDLYLASMYSKAGFRIVRNMPPGLYPDEVMTRIESLISGSQLYRNQGDLAFTASGVASHVEDVGWAYGPMLEDLDNDGLLDLYAPAGYISRDRTKPDG